jgi:cytochrome c553
MRFFIVLMILLTSISLPSLAADIEAGKAKAATCMACHGVNGIGNADMWPNLAGQKKGYLVAQIKAYRSGERQDPMMAPMVKGLTDADIENLAAYYSSLEPCSLDQGRSPATPN